MKLSVFKDQSEGMKIPAYTLPKFENFRLWQAIWVSFSPAVGYLSTTNRLFVVSPQNCAVQKKSTIFFLAGSPHREVGVNTPLVSDQKIAQAYNFAVDVLFGVHITSKPHHIRSQLKNVHWLVIFV